MIGPPGPHPAQNLYLWHITRVGKSDWEDTTSFVAIAATHEEALKLLPTPWAGLSWAKPENVRARQIGIATTGKAGDVICRSTERYSSTRS